MGNPPGGPPDFRPPLLVSTYPESTVVLTGFNDWVEFRFDETVSEGSTPNFGLGTGDLERLVLLSPSKAGEVPRVEWHRSKISVRPRGGWRPNTVYRVELAPGLRDLSDGDRNSVKRSYVVTFATGGMIPTRSIDGRAVDWALRSFTPGALVEAMLLPDSLVYRSVTDSAGRFHLGPLPEGEMLVSVAIDNNRNSTRDVKEAWDTVRIAAGASLVGEVWTFLRDTVPPKLSGPPSAIDSINIALNFAQPIDPALVISADSIRVLWLPDSINKLADSASIAPLSAMPKVAHDSIYAAADAANRAAAAAAKVDTTKPDTTTRPPANARPVRAVDAAPTAKDSATKDEPTDVRPTLGSQLIIRTRGFTRPGGSYFIEIRGVRSAGGQVGTVTGKFSRAAPAPPRKAAADTTKGKRDSTTITPPAKRP